MEVDGPAVTGFWNLSVDRRSRTSDSSQDPKKPNGGVHINVLYDGAPHLSIESNERFFQSLEGGVYTFSAFGRTATASSTRTPGPSRGTLSSEAVVHRTDRTTP